jgi:putative OmpL-like beta-barrel porin-2
MRIIWEAKPGFLIQGHLMNGWQKISEDNDAKSASLRVDVPLVSGLTVAAAGFLGNEQPRGAPRATRSLGQLMLKASPHRDLLVQTQLDLGRQSGPGGVRRWWGTVGIARLGVARSYAVVARLERFSDPDQVVASTGTPAGLAVSGGSIGLDVIGPAGLLWRSEVRGLWGSEPVFPDAGGPAARKSSTVLITSLAWTLQ